MDVSRDPKLCTVYIRDAQGRKFATNVSASSAHEAARAAIKFFEDTFWKGPKPTADTILEISAMGSDTSVRVRVGSLPC